MILLAYTIKFAMGTKLRLKVYETNILKEWVALNYFSPLNSRHKHSECRIIIWIYY